MRECKTGIEGGEQMASLELLQMVLHFGKQRLFWRLARAPVPLLQRYGQHQGEKQGEKQRERNKACGQQVLGLIAMG